MRASGGAALAALLLAATGAAANDLGAGVTFSGGDRAALVERTEESDPRVIYRSGASDAIAGAWDTVLIQGESADPDTVFQAARQEGSEWRDLEIHRFASGRFWAKGRMPKAVARLRLRALNVGPKRDRSVEIYGVEVFVDESAASGAPAAPARGPLNPAAVRPLLHARSEWNAAAPAKPYTPDPLPWRVTLHHSDGRHTTTLADSEEEARFIQDFHVHGRGWNDIAYHFLVDAEGNILEGRPEGTLGAHTLGNNAGNVGIVLLGAYHPPRNDVPTRPQLDAVTALGRYLVARYGIRSNQLKGHRDYRPTDCPGDLAYAKLDALRLAFAGVPSAAALAPQAGLSFDGVQRAQ